MTATDTLYQAIDKLREKNVQMKRLEDEAKELKSCIQLIMGDVEEVVRDGSTICTWKKYTKEVLDTQKLKNDAPDTYMRFLVSREERRFVLKKEMETENGDI